jgi:hypothetical protein
VTILVFLPSVEHLPDLVFLLQVIELLEGLDNSGACYLSLFRLLLLGQVNNTLLVLDILIILID